MKFVFKVLFFLTEPAKHVTGALGTEFGGRAKTVKFNNFQVFFFFFLF